jgi:glyoxylase I family protein
MINGINHVGLSTSDLDRMVAFYRDILGFEVRTGYEWSGSTVIDELIGVPSSAARTCVVSAGNLYLELFQYLNPPTPGPGGALRQPFDRGYTHICIDVTDIDAEHERLTAAGARFNRAPPHQEMSGLKAIYGRDPDGNIIELQETLNDSYGISMSGLPMLRHRSDVVAELADREEIRHKIHLYCRALDRVDEPLLRSVFHPDSEHAHGPFRGRSADFCRYAIDIVRALAGTSHHLSNVTIDLSGHVAHTESYFLAIHKMGKGKTVSGYWEPREAPTEEIAEIGGRYIDRWEKRAGVWKIARRIGVHDWERWSAANLPAREADPAISISPARNHDDPVYRRD